MTAYSNLTQLKAAGWLNISATTYDTDLMRLLNDASKQIDNLCKRSFQPWEGIKYADGSGVMLSFTNFDVLSVTTFALDMDGSQSYATSLDSDNYVLYPLNSFPKTYTKLSHIADVGSFASNIRSGVKITGIFGYGDGVSATPYTDSGAVVNTGGITSSATTHALATGKGALFAIGETIRIGTEQLYISGISSDTLTFTRGQNGTTAATHTAADVIYIYQYPGPITEACLIQATRWWKRRETAFQDAVGNADIGQLLVYKGLDADVKLMIEWYIKRVF